MVEWELFTLELLSDLDRQEITLEMLAHLFDSNCQQLKEQQENELKERASLFHQVMKDYFLFPRSAQICRPDHIDINEGSSRNDILGIDTTEVHFHQQVLIFLNEELCRLYEE